MELFEYQWPDIQATTDEKAIELYRKMQADKLPANDLRELRRLCSWRVLPADDGLGSSYIVATEIDGAKYIGARTNDYGYCRK